MLHNYQAVLGPPGCGKTKFLIDKAIEQIGRGSPTERIGLTTYTRKAADEGAQRIRKATGVNGGFPFFSTLHSICLKSIDVGNERILEPDDKNLYQHMLATVGYSLNSKRGSTIAKVYSLSRASGLDYDMMCAKIFEPRVPPCSRGDLEEFIQSYDQFKAEQNYLDFDDIIDVFLRSGHTPILDLFLVDEAQDLSRNLWRVVEAIGNKAAYTYMVGDEDQQLYAWAGADDGLFVDYFSSGGVLERSYRCSRAVAEKANRVIAPVRTIPKSWIPTEETGAIWWTSTLDPVPFRNGQSWFVLCRTNDRVKKLSQELRERGIYHGTVMHGRTRSGFSGNLRRLLRIWQKLVNNEPVPSAALAWYDKALGQRTEDEGARRNVPDSIDALLRACRNCSLSEVEYCRFLSLSGVEVSKPPNIWVMTINQAKGSQADNVVIDTNVSGEVLDSWKFDLGPETRQAYVAITRARHECWLLESESMLECYSW